MTTNENRGNDASVDLKLEAVVIPVLDVDRAKKFYADLGWRLDADFPFDNGFRVVQFTPPGSACSVQFGTNTTTAVPGSARGLYLVVSALRHRHSSGLQQDGRQTAHGHSIAVVQRVRHGLQSGTHPVRSSPVLVRSYFWVLTPHTLSASRTHAHSHVIDFHFRLGLGRRVGVGHRVFPKALAEPPRYSA